MGLPTAFSSKTKLWFRSKFPYESSFALLQLRHWLFCFDGGFKVQILHGTWSLCIHRCNICCIIYLIIASSAFQGKQKAPGMNLHNRLASINWRFNYFSKFNPGAEALRIDISVLTHYRYVTNQIFSFAFPVATTSMDNHPQAVLSGIRWIQVGRLHDQYCHIYS